MYIYIKIHVAFLGYIYIKYILNNLSTSLPGTYHVHILGCARMLVNGYYVDYNPNIPHL